MKVAIVEFNDHHDEVLPTLVHVLNLLGATPDLYVTARVARRNVFAYAAELRYRLRPIDGASRLRATMSRLRGTPARLGRYDVLFMNSVEPPAVLEAASRVDLPTIALVHNGDLLLGDGPYATYFRAPAREPLVLGRHVAGHLGLGDAWLAPVYLGRVPDREAAEDARPRLCVQGNVEATRRDYAALLEAVAELAAEGSEFMVRVVGRSKTPDGRELRSLVGQRGLRDRFRFSGAEVSHRRYLRLVGTSDFVLPLIHAGMPSLDPYFTVKITSSMSMAIGLGVVPIVEAGFAELHHVERGAVTYEPDGLAAAIRAALALSPAARAERVRHLGAVRKEALASSVANVAAALDRAGSRR